MLTPLSSTRHGFFEQFFPPPKFLEMPAVGLDISDTAVSALELVRRKRGFAVGRYGRRPLPEGSVVGGNVHDHEAVVGELRKLKDALNLDFVNASLSEENAYLFKAKIPRVSRKEIRGVLEFKLEENVPIAARDAIFDYSIITQTSHDGGGDHLDVGVTVLPEKTVETYTELLDAAGLVPLSFEIEAQAVSRAVIPKGDRGTHIIAHLGEEKTGLFIVSDEVVHFTSTIGIGGAHLTSAIANHLSVSTSEALRIKREHRGFGEKEHADLFLALTKAFAELRSEISKLAVYWSTHKDPAGEFGKAIERIVLCGRDALTTGLADYLSLAFDVPVEVGNVWRNVFSFEDYIPPILFDESLDYAAAVGLALPKGH